LLLADYFQSGSCFFREATNKCVLCSPALARALIFLARALCLPRRRGGLVVARLMVVETALVSGEADLHTRRENVLSLSQIRASHQRFLNPFGIHRFLSHFGNVAGTPAVIVALVLLVSAHGVGGRWGGYVVSRHMVEKTAFGRVVTPIHAFRATHFIKALMDGNLQIRFSQLCISNF